MDGRGVAPIWKVGGGVEVVTAGPAPLAGGVIVSARSDRRFWISATSDAKASSARSSAPRTTTARICSTISPSVKPSTVLPVGSTSIDIIAEAARKATLCSIHVRPATHAEGTGGWKDGGWNSSGQSTGTGS